MKIVSGTYIAGANAASVECGFIPDYLQLWTAVNGTELVYTWFRVFGDTPAKTGQYGILDTAGAKSIPTTAATGIIALDTVAQRYMLPNPAGGEDLAAALPVGFVAGTARPTARTATALGTITKPSVGNENGLIAECTTDVSTYGTEPTWPAVAGDSVTDDNSNVWIMREVRIENRGVKGFIVGETVCSDSEIHVFRAEQHDRSADMGDNGLIDPSRFDGT